MDQIELQLAVSFVVSTLENRFGKTTLLDLEKAKEAMKLASEQTFGNDHNLFWMLRHEVSDNDRFETAMVSVFVKCDPEMKRVVEREMRVIRALNAAMTGIQVDMGAALEELKDQPTIGLMRIFADV